MKKSFSYLSPSDRDKDFGLYITVSGNYTASPYSPYPERDHPSGYYFDWETGRTINEYQIIYIVEGEGYLEYQQKSFIINKGSILFIRPNEHHRYQPKKETGWTERYVGFSGRIANRVLLGLKNQVVIELGNSIEIIEMFKKIETHVEKKNPSFQKICAGLLIQLIGLIEAQTTTSLFENKKVLGLIENTIKTMKENLSQELNFEYIATGYGMSYSHFRQSFKLYTGLSPHSYFIDLKIQESKRQILSTSKNMTEIAYDLGFNSLQYFSKLFKKRVGVSPQNYRRPKVDKFL